MKDIKTLYITAKNTRSQKDISLYSEAVEELIKDDPKSFILNLEYIITSDMNLSKLDKFVEKYGLPIPVCNYIIEHLEKCVDKCNKLSKDSTLFKESLDKYTRFKSEHKNCFNMYEYYIDDPSKEDIYINTYYSSNSSGIQNRKLVAGMINKFGEAVIPDMLIESNIFGPKAINTLYEFLNGLTKLDSTCYQWITECSNELNNNVPAYSEIVSKSLQSIVDNKISETRNIIRESVIMGDEDSYIPYTESDVNSIKDLICFTEYKLTCTESPDEALTLQNKIYSLYEELDGLIEEDGEQSIDIIESLNSDENECIKKVSNKLISFAKELDKNLKGTISDIKDEIRQTGDRDEKKLIRFNFVRGRVAIGNKEKPFGIFAINSIKAKRDTIKLLKDDLKSNSKYLNDLKYHAIIEIETSIKLNDKQKSLFRDIADRIFLNSSIKKYIDDGILNISPCREFHNKDPKKSVFSENNVMNEYVIVTYNYSIYWVINLSREYAFDGIDTSIFESINNVGYLLNLIIESTDYTVISENRMSNTNNKYTGEIPAYLANNHDLKYGEDNDKSIEDFKRPSVKAKEDNIEQPESDKLYNYSDLDNKENDDEEAKSPDSHATNNYYYYTYTNSLNKNSNSFNKDSSTHDDHSTHNRRVTDDHSTNKRINSNDYRSDYSDEEEDITESSTTNRPITTLFMLSSLDGKISTGSTNERDVDKDFPNIPGIDKGLQQYYDIEKTTELWSMNSGAVQAKIGANTKTIEKVDNPVVSFAIIDNKNLNEHGVRYLCAKTKNLVIITMNKNHPAKSITDEPGLSVMEVSDISKDISDIMKRLYTEYKCKRLTVQTGATLNALLLENNLIDYVDLVIAPVLIGGTDTPGVVGGKSAITDSDLNKLSVLKLRSVKKLNDSYIRVKYSVEGKRTFTESVGYGIDDKIFLYAASLLNESGIKPYILDDFIQEAVGDADNMKPESDHPIKDAMQDMDRSLAKSQQAAKKKVQGVINTANTFIKPVKRTHQWVMKLVNDWKDKNETEIKEKFADPHARKNIFNAITWCIKTGSLAKAGLLLNPIFLFLTITKKISKKDNNQRIRHEMIGELKAELEIIDVKIQDAAKNNHDSDKYRLMRFKNEINKKLLRVGGSDVRSWKKVI